MSPIQERDFTAIQSFARGGLANAWGAGLYRFTDEDLARFPIAAHDLDPHFDELTQEIGISGTNDDLTPFFGSTDYLQPAIELSHNASRLHRNYIRSRERLRGELYIGHSRTGVLTQPKNARPALDYSNLEFWQEQPSIYSPQMTLDKLTAAGDVDYRAGMLARRYTAEKGRCVKNSARIGDVTSIGARLNTTAFGLVQLNLELRQGVGHSSLTTPITNPTAHPSPGLRAVIITAFTP